MSEAANSLQSVTVKKPRGKPFQKGQSGNPNGRPAIIRDIQTLARAHTVTAFDALIEVVKDRGAPPSARVAAASQVLDRAYGKPTAFVEAKIQSIQQMTDDDLVSFLSRIDTGDSGEGAIEAEERPSLAM